MPGRHNAGGLVLDSGSARRRRRERWAGLAQRAEEPVQRGGAQTPVPQGGRSLRRSRPMAEDQATDQCDWRAVHRSESL